MSISAARVTRLGLSGYGVAPYGDFSGRAFTEADRSAGRPRRYTYTLPNGVRINGTRAEVDAAVNRFKPVEKPEIVTEKQLTVKAGKPLPTEILAAMPERVPLNIVEPPAPVAIPDIDLIRDDEAVLVLLLA